MKVAVIGLGYVGVPLAVEFARGGLDVVGIDVDAERVGMINAGKSPIKDVCDIDMIKLKLKNQLRATTNFDALADCDAACICVPTPLSKSHDPDVSYIVAAVEEVARRLHPGMLVVLESTTYPGTTEELVLPRLAESGLTVGKDFHLAFSPERVDPGNTLYGIRNTPKVVGGVTPACTERAVALYRHAVDTVIPVAGARVAEMVKLLENTFRAVNIGLANELAVMCERLGVNVWEVVDAAKTKPFGFMPFYPGPGIGGHCIPIDPLYLSWKLRTMNYTARFIDLATAINSKMPEYVVSRVADALNDDGLSIRGSRILVLGVTYKPDVADLRESPALDVMRLLDKKGAALEYVDPYVQKIQLGGRQMECLKDCRKQICSADCVLILTAHNGQPLQHVLHMARLVFDTRNATAGLDVPAGCRVVRL